MPWADLSEGFSGLKQWSEPVIYDRLIAAYRKLISDHELSRNLTRTPCPGLARPYPRRHGGV